MQDKILARATVLILNTCVLMCLLVSGCSLDFGSDYETHSPSQQDLDRCRRVMFLNPGLSFTPLGVSIMDSGIDSAIWLAFDTDTADPAQLFQTNIVDISELTGSTSIQMAPGQPGWWTAGTSSYVGGQVALPSATFMTVAIDTNRTPFRVYLSWFET
jgi:hypothetical protein